MRVLFSYYLIIQACLLCCISVASESTSVPISIDFAFVQKMKPGALTKTELIKLLGKPAEIFNFKDLPNSKEAGESWKYEELGYERLIVFFNEGSQTAKSLNWGVRAEDPEQKLKTAMSRYPGAVWIPETDKWINPHSFPNECFFMDKKLGISIEYNRARNEVFSIDRWDPTRRLASFDKDEKPPQFCIGNGCSPGIRPEVFFKEVPISKYCEVPK